MRDDYIDFVANLPSLNSVFRYCVLLTCPDICYSLVQDAYSEVASLFAEFFRDLDIVPSDIIAGLVLLRQRQRSKRSSILDQVSLSMEKKGDVRMFVLL